MLQAGVLAISVTIILMKNNRFHLALYLIFAVFLAIGTASCSRKSGCPAENTHTEVDKRGNYKTGKTTSGLGLVPKDAKKRKK